MGGQSALDLEAFVWPKRVTSFRASRKTVDSFALSHSTDNMVNHRTFCLAAETFGVYLLS